MSSHICCPLETNVGAAFAHHWTSPLPLDLTSDPLEILKRQFCFQGLFDKLSIHAKIISIL